MASPATWPITSASDLDVPDRLVGDDREVRCEIDRPEEIPPTSERVRDQRDDELALDHREREVVRDHVCRGDRDERENEVGDERAANAAELLGRRDRGEVRREDRRNEEEETGEIRRPSPPGRWSAATSPRGSHAAASMRSDQRLDRLKPSKLVEPTMTATKRSAPGVRSSPARPVKGHRTTTRPSRAVNGAMRESSSNITANPSPPRVHASRP